MVDTGRRKIVYLKAFGLAYSEQWAVVAAVFEKLNFEYLKRQQWAVSLRGDCV